MSVAKEIVRQLGNKTLFMIGAKNLLAGENSLGFKIMRNEKKVNYIRIKLNSLDLYDVEYMYVTMKTIKTISKDEGLYSDMLEASIQENTGLYTKL